MCIELLAGAKRPVLTTLRFCADKLVKGVIDKAVIAEVFGSLEGCLAIRAAPFVEQFVTGVDVVPIGEFRSGH